jgi:hypothetical protein
MAGQLGQVSLDVAEDDAAPVFVGALEQVRGQQLAGLDHAHGVDRRPAIAWV